MASKLSSSFARAGALTLSVGIFGLLLFRSATGCRSGDATVRPEPSASSAKATQAPGPMTASPPASQSAGAQARPRYFPGSKAPAGRWADDEEDAKKPAPNQPPAQQK